MNGAVRTPSFQTVLLTMGDLKIQPVWSANQDITMLRVAALNAKDAYFVMKPFYASPPAWKDTKVSIMHAFLYSLQQSSHL